VFCLVLNAVQVTSLVYLGLAAFLKAGQVTELVALVRKKLGKKR
jgi:hypothetical protein